MVNTTLLMRVGFNVDASTKNIHPTGWFSDRVTGC